MRSLILDTSVSHADGSIDIIINITIAPYMQGGPAKGGRSCIHPHSCRALTVPDWSAHQQGVTKGYIVVVVVVVVHRRCQPTKTPSGAAPGPCRSLSGPGLTLWLGLGLQEELGGTQRFW